MTEGVTEVDLALLRTLPLPELPEDSDKDARGQVLVVAGGPRVPGAPLLTGLAALRAGAGKLQLAATRASAFALGMAAPEAAIVGVYGEADGELGLQAATLLVEAAQAADAVVVGPGMMGRDAPRLAARLLEDAPDARFVVDAGAMTDILHRAPRREREPRLVLTPHAGEMAKMLGGSRDEVQRDPRGAARQAAQTAGAVVVLKGQDSYIAAPDGRLWRHSGGGGGGSEERRGGEGGRFRGGAGH